MDPAKFCGLGEGAAHVIRNAGGRASDDAIRSLMVWCKLMGTTDWFVIHHTGCGMHSYSDEAQNAGDKWRNVWKSARTPADIEWMTFNHIHHGTLEPVPEANQIASSL
jgi:carbonic anhydrase